MIHVAMRRKGGVQGGAKRRKRIGGKLTGSGKKKSGGGGGGNHGGFKSKAQWKWAFANGYRWARKKAHKTAGGPKARFRRLPWRKTLKKGKRRRL